MWERIFENFDSIVISAEGAGEATEEGEELVDTEAAGAVRHDVLVGEKECQHQLPLLGLCQQTEVDMFRCRKWRIVAGGAFDGMKFILHMPEAKQGPFSRLKN